MEKRVLGIILSLLGVAGIVYAAISFVNGGTGTANIKIIAAFGIVGAIFFFAGIGLVRNTKDKPTWSATTHHNSTIFKQQYKRFALL